MRCRRASPHEEEGCASGPGYVSDDAASHVQRADELARTSGRHAAGKGIAVQRNGSAMRLLASFTAGDNGNLASRRQEPIESAQALLDHKHITTAQITIGGGGRCRIMPRTRCRVGERRRGYDER
jgi:hypothetical protein